jgi:hypothetical protein
MCPSGTLCDYLGNLHKSGAISNIRKMPKKILTRNLIGAEFDSRKDLVQMDRN